jgi:hypothetical protein
MRSSSGLRKRKVYWKCMPREYWELVILDELLQAKFAPFLILKGGMALRLKYQSPRFSNDIDLGALQDVPYEEFRKAVHRIAEKHGLTVTDDHDKYGTLYANFMVPGDTRKGKINIKIELSKRHNIRAQGREYAALRLGFVPQDTPDRVRPDGGEHVREQDTVPEDAAEAQGHLRFLVSLTGAAPALRAGPDKPRE